MTDKIDPITGPWKLLESTYSYRDQWLTLRSDTVELPNGQTLKPFHVLEAPDWVNVFAFTPARDLVLVEQYRHPVKSLMLEMPAGNVDKGETALEAAKRELLEETGYASDTWHDLGALFTVASRIDNKVHTYLALDARPIQEPEHEIGEHIRVRTMPWAKFVAGLYGGDWSLREAPQFASVLQLHLYAKASGKKELTDLIV